jgi:hypothetical protein
MTYCPGVGRPDDAGAEDFTRRDRWFSGEGPSIRVLGDSEVSLGW